MGYFRKFPRSSTNRQAAGTTAGSSGLPAFEPASFECGQRGSGL